jgi:XH domain-containing protein
MVQDTLQKYITMDVKRKEKEQQLRLKFLEAVDEKKDVPHKWLGMLSDKCRLFLHDYTQEVEIVNRYVRNPSFYPFTIKLNAAGEFSSTLDENNDQLVQLRQMYCSEIVSGILQAIREMVDYGNGSGRYPICVPWNYETNQPLGWLDFATQLVDRLPGPTEF